MHFLISKYFLKTFSHFTFFRNSLENFLKLQFDISKTYPLEPIQWINFFSKITKKISSTFQGNLDLSPSNQIIKLNPFRQCSALTPSNYKNMKTSYYFKSPVGVHWEKNVYIEQVLFPSPSYNILYEDCKRAHNKGSVYFFHCVELISFKQFYLIALQKLKYH